MILIFLSSCFLATRGQVVKSSDKFPYGWYMGDLNITDSFFIDASLKITGGLILSNTLTVAGDSSNMIKLEVDYIIINANGKFLVGSEDKPFLGHLDILLTGNNQDRGMKGIFVMEGGVLDLHGTRKGGWSRMKRDVDPVEQNETAFLHLESWPESLPLPGDQLVVASSDRNPEQAELVEVVECQADSICEVKGPLKFKHIGSSRNHVEFNAEVGLLSHNIRIRGELGDTCTADQLVCEKYASSYSGGLNGGQIVANRGFSAFRIEQVEILNMGHAKGGYPVHWKNCRTLKAGSSYVKDCSIHHSLNRGVVCEGTTGCHVESTVVYSTFGHAFYGGQGSRKLQLVNNLGLVVRGGLATEEDWTETAVFWIQSPDSRVEGNVAAGSDNNGIMLPWGPRQHQQVFWVFQNNSVHSCRNGLQLGTVGKGSWAKTWGQMVAGEERETHMYNTRCYRCGRCYRVACSRCVLQGWSSADTGVGLLAEGGPSQCVDCLFVGHTDGFNSSSLQLPGVEGTQWGVRFTAGQWQLKNVKFVNYEDFYHMGNSVMKTWALGWRFAWNQVTLSGIHFERVPSENRVHLDSQQFSTKFQYKTNLRDEMGDLLGQPGTVLSIVNENFFKPQCDRVPGWGFLVFCPDLPGSSQLFLTSSEAPQTQVFPVQEGILELDTGPTAPTIQVVHNARLDRERQLRLSLASLNATKTVVLGYCMPAKATIQVSLNGKILRPLTAGDFIDVLQYDFDDEGDHIVAFFYDESSYIVYIVLAVSNNPSSWLFKEHDELRIRVLNGMDGSTDCLERGPCYLNYDPNAPCNPERLKTNPRSFSVELPSECVCGLAKRKGASWDAYNPFDVIDILKDLKRPRVINGVETEKHEFPWQCGLVKPTGNMIWCGCSLLANQWVITARHCTIDKTKEDLQVILGEWRTKDNSKAAIGQRLRMDIDEIHVHPGYNPVLMDNDFALLKLEGKVPLRDYPHIRPIGLPKAGDDVEETETIVAGWGLLSQDSILPSDNLMRANLTIMSNKDCKSKFDYPAGNITENMFCAKSGHIEGEPLQDACQGDSGGPLISRGSGDGTTPGQGYTLVGVVSWGYGCGQAMYPGVFARVTKALGWIHQITQGSWETCPRSVSSQGDSGGGTVESPGYPGNYPHNRDEAFILLAAEGKTINVTFKNLDIEYNMKCAYDFVMAKDGDGTELMAKTCGSKTPPPAPFISRTNKVEIIFHSDFTENRKGFQLTWREVGPGPSGGSLMSPNYPKTYPINLDKTFLILADSGKRIILTFTDFAVESHRSCRYDYVKITDGDGTLLMDKKCGGSKPDTVISRTSKVEVLLHTDGSLGEKGFKLVWTAV